MANMQQMEIDEDNVDVIDGAGNAEVGENNYASPIVGSPQLRVGDIIKALKKNENAEASLTEHWIDFVQELGVAEAKIKVYEDDLLLKRRNPVRVVELAILDWCRRKGKLATLTTLISTAKALQMENVEQVLKTFDVPPSTGVLT